MNVNGAFTKYSWLEELQKQAVNVQLRSHTGAGLWLTVLHAGSKHTESRRCHHISVTLCSWIKHYNNKVRKFHLEMMIMITLPQYDTIYLSDSR